MLRARRSRRRLRRRLRRLSACASLGACSFGSALQLSPPGHPLCWRTARPTAGSHVRAGGVSRARSARGLSQVPLPARSGQTRDLIARNAGGKRMHVVAARATRSSVRPLLSLSAALSTAMSEYGGEPWQLRYAGAAPGKSVMCYGDSLTAGYHDGGFAFAPRRSRAEISRVLDARRPSRRISDGAGTRHRSRRGSTAFAATTAGIRG